jgi:hypothetical protein
LKYGYSVCFTGSGKLDGQSTALGFCSQFAVFCRDAHDISLDGIKISDAERPYKLIETIIYPKAAESTLSMEDKIEEIKFQLSCIFFTARNRMGWDDDEEDDTDKELRIHFVCGLEKLWEKLAIQRICADRVELKQVLLAAEFTHHDGSRKDGEFVVEGKREVVEDMPWSSMVREREEEKEEEYWLCDFVEDVYEQEGSDRSEERYESGDEGYVYEGD